MVGSISFKKIFNIYTVVSRRQSMESHEGNDKYLKFNSEINLEPVRIYKNRCIMTELG